MSLQDKAKASISNAATNNAVINATNYVLCNATACTVTVYVATIVIGGCDQPLSPENRGVGECDAPLFGDCITPFACGASLNKRAKPKSIPLRAKLNSSKEERS